jgi:hypothetical protein
MNSCPSSIKTPLVAVEDAAGKVDVEAIEAQAVGSRGFAFQPIESLRMRDVFPMFLDDVVPGNTFRGLIARDVVAFDLFDVVCAFSILRGLVHEHSASSLNLSGTVVLGKLLSDIFAKLDVGAAPPRRIVISSHRELHRLPLLAMKVRPDGPGQCVCDSFSGGVYFVPTYSCMLSCVRTIPLVGMRRCPSQRYGIRSLWRSRVRMLAAPVRWWIG